MQHTDKFTLAVVDLSHIELVTEEDRKSRPDQWTRMFKAKTWEELRMSAQENPVIDQAVSTIHELTEEDIIREQMEMLEESYRVERKDCSLRRSE